MKQNFSQQLRRKKSFYYLCFVSASAHAKLESCIVLNEHNTVFTQSAPLYATNVSLGPAVVEANGISIVSAVFARLTRLGDRPTDKPADHSTRIGNNRRSLEWRSQILLLSTASATRCFPETS